jgi:hypothetical protein
VIDFSHRPAHSLRSRVEDFARVNKIDFFFFFEETAGRHFIILQCLKGYKTDLAFEVARGDDRVLKMQNSELSCVLLRLILSVREQSLPNRSLVFLP